MTLRIDPSALSRPELSLSTSDAERASALVEGDADFASVLAAGLQRANEVASVARTKVDALARGASDDLHGTMISAKEADISIKLVGTVRNKLLDAFHELWRINL
jgi:flagellar hook-basal body complex protein FliE